MIETILSYIQVFFGLVFFFYLPGYFLVKIFFNSSKQEEKIILSILFSIVIGMSIGVFFGYDRAQALRTGGFTADNLWVAELLLTALLVFTLALKNIIKRHPYYLARKKRRESLKHKKNG